MFKNPFDAKSFLGRRCSCGAAHEPQDHDKLTANSAQAAVPGGDEARWNRVVDAAVLRAVFPVDATRRQFLRTVGAGTAMAAISSVLPLGVAREAFAQGGAPEKKDLKIGFIPITCATPIIMAHPMGFYAKQGLNVEVVKTAGWAVIRDKALAKEYDAAHMLSPMPLAISLGVGSNPVPYSMPAIENINGQAITLSVKHKDKRDPRQWKGFKFAVPFDYSMHNYLLRYYVAEHGLDPDVDISIRSVPPPEMVANLRADNIDGFLGPDPFNQRAVYDGVGYIHLLTKELWEEYGNRKERAGASTAGLHFGLRLLREVFGWSEVEACNGWQQGESARTHTTQGGADRLDGFAGSPNRHSAAEWGHGHRHCSTD